MRNAYSISVSLKERDHLGDLGIGWRIILKWILNRVRGCRLNSTGLGYSLMVGSCKHGNEPLGSIKSEKLIDQLSDSTIQEGLCSVELEKLNDTLL
jgi:hypothetical protein